MFLRPCPRDRTSAAPPAAAALLLCTAWAHASEPPSPPRTDPEPLPDPRLLGDPWGARSGLEERGIALELYHYVDWTRTLDGGVRGHDTVHRTFLDLDLTVDLERVAGLPAATLRAEFWRIGGDSRPDGSGALQDPSGLAAERRAQLAQLWYDQPLPDLGLRVRVGKLDPTYEFAVVESGWGFLNSGVTWPPNLVGVPVYPDPAVGAELFVEPEGPLALALGVFDGSGAEGVETGRGGARRLFGSPADLCHLAEVRLRWGEGEPVPRGRLGVGAWHHTGTFPRRDGGTEDGVEGIYVVADQRVLSESDDPQDAQGVSAFARATWTDGEVGPLARHCGAGMVVTGPLPGRPADGLGLAVLVAEPGDARRGRPDRTTETVLELYYEVRVTPWLVITPDLQFIRHPRGHTGTDDAFVAALRITTAF